MKRFLWSLKDKRFRYGTFSTLMVLLAVAVFVLVNLVTGQLNISHDLTSDRMFSLSEYSEEFLAELDTDVTLYALSATGQENLLLNQLLEEYAAATPHVRIERRDPALYPTFVEGYADPGEEVETNSVIVDSGEKSRIVHYGEMFTQDLDMNTFQYNLTSIDIEPKITQAIHYVTMGETPTVYHVTGSGESPLPEALVSQFENSNFDVGEANLVTDIIPEDCDMLVITAPQRDWSSDEAARIQTYFESDGRALIVLGYQSERFTNLDNVLAAYGVRVSDQIVLEGNPSYYYMGNPTFLMPEFSAHDITQQLLDGGYRTLQVEAAGIEETEIKKTRTEIVPLITTSGEAYGKRNTQSETVNKEPGDTDGPFNLAVAVTDSVYTDTTHTCKLVLFSSPVSMLDESVDNVTGGTNWGLLINSANWLYGETSGIYIPAKTPPSSTQLQMTQGQANIIALIAVIILPLAIIGTGLFVWLRRRHS